MALDGIVLSALGSMLVSLPSATVTEMAGARYTNMVEL